MNTARRPAIQAIAPPREDGVPGTRARERAAFAARVTGLTFAIACSQFGRVETGTNTELANTSGNRTHEAGCLSCLGAADGQCNEGKDPAQREPEGADERYAAEGLCEAGLEAEADDVADDDHQHDDQDVADEVGRGAPDEHRRACHRHRAEAVDHAELQVVGQAYCRLAGPERHRLDEDAGQQIVDVAHAGGQ